MDAGKIFAAVIGLLVLAILLSFVLAFPVMWLWNFAVVAAIPTVAVKITFWQAWCLMILCHFLFKANVSVNKSGD